MYTTPLNTFKALKCHRKVSLRRYSVKALTARPKAGDRVVIAMSGGVDSSVSACLLAAKNYDLSAVFMRNWDTRDESGTDIGCEWEKDWEDVQRVCKILKIPCEMLDLSVEYWNRVFEPSLRMWEKGETPNPDVLCNREVKFGALVDKLMEKVKLDWLATGHYAGTEWVHQSGRIRPKLTRSKDEQKDQTYYLSAIRESSLRKAIFPLQNLTKREVRELAYKHNLPNASKTESMGICFVGVKKRFEDFLSNYIAANPGPIIDYHTRREIGTHTGLWKYTIGQRAKLKNMLERMVVAKKDVMTNALYVTPASRGSMLKSYGLVVRDFKWIWENGEPNDVSQDGLHAGVQFRHGMKDVPCIVKRNNEQLLINFDEPCYAVAPGQVAAIYDGKYCLGGGIIDRIINTVEQ